MENITIKHNKRSKKLEITVQNSLTVENIDELKSNAAKYFEGNKQINLKLQSIENIDIGGIQFIYALQKEAKNKEVGFNLSFEGNDEISTLLKKTGFENFLLTKINN